MSRNCVECGKEVPEDMDFCPYCGCDKGFVTVGSNGLVELACPKCGTPYKQGDLYCGSCGAALPDVDNVSYVPQIRKHGMIAIVLALIPGMFNIFGLGHLVLKSYSRGAMFLIISVVIWYLNGWSFYSSSIIVLLLEVVVYFYQTIDVARLAYTPEER